MKTKREKAMKKFLKAYREYEQAKKELRLETGWSFIMNQTIHGYEDTASERDALVNKINEISKEFNTK